MVDSFIKAVVKNGDKIVTNGVRNGAKGAANSAKKTARVLQKKDYSGSNFNRFKADMAVVSAQRMGEPKPLFKDDDGALFITNSMAVARVSSATAMQSRLKSLTAATKGINNQKKE